MIVTQALILYLREVDFVRHPHLFVHILLVSFAVLTVQLHVVDNTQCHKQSPPAVVLSFFIWLVLGVEVHHPLVEGKYSLDVPLADTAVGRDFCLVLVQPT